MNNSRIPSLSVYAFLLLFTGLTSRAQLVTNQAILQKASQQSDQQHSALQRLLNNTARQKGWPLIFRNKKGRMAYLRGIDTKGFPVYVITNDNIISAATIGTNKLWPGGSTGLNLNGSSANMKSKIAIWDEGLVRPTHVELVGRVTQVDKSPTLSDHSTHVSGTLIAAGVNPLAKGMSFGALQLLCNDFDNDESEMMAAAAKGLLVSNHSYADIAGWNFDDTNNEWQFWGNPGDTVDIKFGLYDSDTQIWDSIAYNAPDYLIVKAGGNNPGETGPAVGQTYWRMNANGIFINAGARPANISSNAGFNTIATYGTAKNILTIGAVNPIPGGYSSPSDVVLASFSSLGPSGDGRIKPDLVADGVDVLSSVSTADNAYDIFSGTSMASPATAGSSFLLQEYYSKLHGGAFMRSATLKGLLIHTTDEAGPNPGPDYYYGWGLIDMPRAASLITSNNTDQWILENNLVNGTDDADSFSVVASGKTGLFATISWTDPPAVPRNPSGANFQDTTRKLINDLDLRITDNTSGTVYQPWVLNPFKPANAATRGDNIRDNVEKVQVDSLVPGRTYKIKITHKATLQRGSQAYSLLVSGIGGTADCASASAGPGASIDQVTLSNLSNTNPSNNCRTYTDLSSQTAAARLPVGQATSISVVNSSCNGTNANRVITVYIDFNNNGSFNDPGEMVAQSASGPGGTFTAPITVPTSVLSGVYARMRIIAEETGNPASVSPCGSYGNGETQDYRVLFTNSSIDAGVTALEYPTITTCANDSQLVAVHIRNFGINTLSSVPVTTVVKSGGAVVATLTATCLDSIEAGKDVIFTYNTSFATVAGTQYTFISTTSLPGDTNPANDSNTATLTVSAAAAAPTGTATICGANATEVVLKATAAGDDIPLWYDSPTATTPIAAGALTSSSDITSDKKYYVAVNDLKAKGGAANKTVYENTGTTNYGAYFRFNGNFVSFTTSVPLTIESAKMYIGHAGQFTFTLATLASYTSSGYSYLPISTTTIDVYPTKTVPSSDQQINVPVGDNSDTGAYFYLNIPVPTPGDYIIIIDCSDSTNGFVNANIKTNPYPVTLPGILSITGNDFRDFGHADSISFQQGFYFPFYDIGIRLSGCPSPRTAVTATTAQAPVITLSGNVLSSNVATGNQWYINDSLLAGSTGQQDTVRLPGVYQDIVKDPLTGCSLPSNKITFTPGGNANASIGLTVFPNPSNGVFQLQFFMSSADNTSVVLINTLGQKVYEADYPNFSGLFSQQLSEGNLASGMYVLKIVHGGNTYIEKIIVKK
jgi:Subtilase family/GEVED domain/Secretion system C-terminal sorting domain